MESRKKMKTQKKKEERRPLRQHTETMAEFAQRTGKTVLTIRNYMSNGILDVDKTERPARVIIDGPKTRDFIKSCEISSVKRKNIKSFMLDNTDENGTDECSIASLQQLKLQNDIRKSKIQIDTMRGKLVSRKTIKAFFSQIVSMDNSIIRPMGQLVSPSIINMCKSCDLADPQTIINVQKLIDDQIYKLVDMKCKKIEDFLKTLGNDNENE
jgi:hypothetical protein